MLIRLKRLTGLTRWAATKGANLQRVTVVYAENGRGKTSLAATLRSLAQADPTPILERRSIGAAEQPRVEFLFSLNGTNTPVSFDSTQWIGAFSDIEVFDTQFVSANVYSGNAIEPEHRRGLHKFVLGASNVQLAHAIDALDAEIRRLGADLKSAEDKLSAITGDSFSLESFLALSSPSDIADQISRQQERVTLAEQVAPVSSTPSFAPITIGSPDIAGLLASLDSSLDDVAAEAESRVRTHINAHLGEHGEDWLARGLDYNPASDLCPFCGQNTSSLTLVEAYRTYFSEAYAAHRERINGLASTLVSTWKEADAEVAQGIIDSNRAIAPFWLQHGVSGPEDKDLVDLISLWAAGRKIIERLFVEKKKDILKSVVPSAKEQAQLADLATALGCVAPYNAAANAADCEVHKQKLAAAGTNLATERTALRRLLVIQQRADPQVEELCLQVMTIRSAKVRKEKDKKIAREALDNATTDLFAKYQAAINKHLERSGCNYRITGTKTVFAGGKPRTEYQLLLNGKSVDLTPPNGSPLAPHFGNTLSDGDRSTLAFALFLARLDLDTDIGKKIVVIDDPMTSLDAHRRAYTRERVCHIARHALQVIVLSHDAHFTRDVWDGIILPKTALTLEAEGDNTVISDWDIVTATQSEYFLRCEMILDCIQGTRTSDRLGTVAVLRPVLEGNLRMRFPRLFPSDKWLGDFISLIRNAPSTSPLARMQPQLQELADINDYTKRYHHDSGPIPGVSQPHLAELQSYCKRTMDLIAGVETT
jgi:wobble nucleotide-excising tRNase